MQWTLRFFLMFAVTLVACDEPAPTPADGGVDTALPDRAPPMPVSTDHCRYEAMPRVPNAGTMVEAGGLRAGAAEAVLALPVGSSLGAYTARARGFGGGTPVDARSVPYAGGFFPSVGFEHAPRVRVIALSAGGETVVIVKADLGATDDSITVDLARRLGPSFAGKVIVSSNHSHSAWGHTMASEVLGLGFSSPRAESRRRLLDVFTATAQRALDTMVPSRLGIAHDANFDPMHRVTRDRRDANDDLPDGRNRKDRDLFVLRVDRMDGTPLAVMPVVGIHGTVLGEGNNLASTEAPGAIERAVEETFDRPVVVMHMQGAGGDVSPAGSGGIECMGHSICYDFARIESVGRNAVASVRAAWERAGTSMTNMVALEAVTRAVPLGPDWRTFSVRGGALSYAPFDGERLCDGQVFTDAGTVLSPIDEFNAPFGAGLCGDRRRSALPSMAQMPGTYNVLPYRSCSRVEHVAPFLGPIFQIDAPTGVVPCGATRTLLSALRINDHVFVTLPGEPVTLLADRLRMQSPAGMERTVVLGYAQGHMGYLLHAEDWLRGGYEPSINLWGPLEGEYLMERSVELARLAMSPMRDDGGTGTTFWRPREPVAQPSPDAAPRAGMVPSEVPATVFFPSTVRGAPRPTRAQPDAMVPRLGLARFVWIGEDPLAGTPVITLQRETAPGTFRDVTRRSGRPVQDADMLTAWTPDPLMSTSARTHYWVTEWQAVPPMGQSYPDDLSDRMGVTAARYRFHVVGTGYMVDSDPFTVTPATLLVSAQRMGTSLRVTTAYESRTGWRLLDDSARSNRAVPLRDGLVDVMLTPTMGAPRTLRMQRTDAMGVLTLAAAADVRSVQITDRHGNVGTTSL